MHANGRAVPDPYRDWINQSRHPLFWEAWQVKPTADKLAAIRAALDDGADPNMIDRESSPPDHSGRPLHCAIAAGRTLSRNQGVVPWAATRGNLPVIELLLERGADPRLEGMAPRPGPQWLLSPIEEAGVNMAYPTGNPGEDFEEVKAFYTQAVVLMKAAAEKLDSKCRSLLLHLSLQQVLQKRRLIVTLYIEQEAKDLKSQIKRRCQVS